MIIDPWGRVLASCDDGEGIGIVDIDLNLIDTIRKKMPVYSHRRPDVYNASLL